MPPSSPRFEADPIVAVVPEDPEDPDAGAAVLHSLRLQGPVHVLRFHAPVLSAAASPRTLVLALPGQVVALDAATLEPRFSCLSHVPRSGPAWAALEQGGWGHPWGGSWDDAAARADGRLAPAPLALGSRWLAYADAQPAEPDGDIVAAQRVRVRGGLARGLGGKRAGAPGPGGLRGVDAATASDRLQAAARAAARAAATRSRAGLAAAGSYVSERVATWRAARRGQQAGWGSWGAPLGACHVDASQDDDAACGTVAVRDVVTRHLVLRFRAHEGPVACLAWSACGDSLATAAAAGRGVNVFRIVPATGGRPACAEHLYRLVRGLTPSCIQSVSFDDRVAVVVSGAGTAHVYDLAGPSVAPERPADVRADGSARPPMPGVVGKPARLAASARARRPGALPGGVESLAGGAGDALRGSRAPSARVPAAAALAAPTEAEVCTDDVLAAGGSRDAHSAIARLVLASGGLLASFDLRAPVGAAASGEARGSDGSDDGTTPSRAPAAPLLAETDRWDVCRTVERPEREAALPTSPPRPHRHAKPSVGVKPAPLHLQQAWLSYAPAACVSTEPPFSTLSQFRFVEVDEV